MTTIVASWTSAEEALQALAAAAAAYQTYSATHPRVTAAVSKTIEVLDTFFSSNPDAPHMTFLRNGPHLEFRNIPLANTGPLVDRLLKTLKSRDFGGIQLERGIQAADVSRLLEEIGCASLAKHSEPVPIDGRTASKNPSAAAKFHLATRAEVERLRLEGKLSEGMEDPWGGLSVPEFQGFEEITRSLFTTYREVITKPEESLSLGSTILTETIDQVMSLMGRQQEKVSVGKSSEYFDDFTYHHSVNVCLISVMTARGVVEDTALLRRISLAALLHDVGKSRIPEEILLKPGRLTPGELDIMQQHPTHGAEILLGAHEIDPLCVAVAFGHHKPFGKTPYPKTRRPYSCDWLTRLISVVDMYEALTATRPYKKGMSSEAALRIILTMPGIEADLPIVRLLYAAVGPFPVGSFVELSTGERALVLAVNPDAPRRPVLRILTDPSLQPLEEPLNINLASSQHGATLRTVLRVIVRQSPDHKVLEDEIVPEPTEILGAPLPGNEVFASREG